MEPSLSPDGAQVLVGVLRLPEGDLSIFDAAATDRSSRVTFGAVAISPIWSPDGRHVLASTPTSAGMRMVLRSASGAGPEQTLLESATSVFADDWSRDGKLVLFERSGEGGSVDLWLLPTTGDRTPLPYVATPANESHASFSPDGRYVAYVSDESGSPEVYVQTLPRSESRWQLSSGGADQPQWSADGKELYFLAADRRLMAVPLRSLEPFDAGAPHPLFRLPVGGIAATGPRSVYAFSPDHSRVLVNALVDSPEEAGIQVVLNWQPVPRSR